MNLQNTLRDRRTIVDDVFDYLYEEISTLRLRPGDKISEADIATRFGVSRQPVRDAFSRLENLELLLIRPQRATEVRRFSLRNIEKSRFVRAAVEAEVLRRAARTCTADHARQLNQALKDQEQAIDAGNYQSFGALDYEFHRLLCTVAGVDFAFEVISAEKAKVDRLCILSLAKEDRMPQLLEDHRQIVVAIENGDALAAVDVGMVHLSRLDETVDAIAVSKSQYFEPEDD